MIRLVRPTLEHKEKALAYRQEHFDHGEKIINGSELFDKTESVFLVFHLQSEEFINLSCLRIL